MKEARAEHKPYPTDLTDAQWSEIEPLYSGDAESEAEQARTDKCRAVYRKDRLSMAAASARFPAVSNGL